MGVEAQLKLLNLYKGYTIAQALHRLEIAEAFVATKQVSLRCKLSGLKIGD